MENENNTENQLNTVNETQTTVQNTYNSNVVDVSVPPIGSVSPTVTESPKKSKKGLIAVIISVLVVVLLGVGLVLLLSNTDADKNKNNGKNQTTEKIENEAEKKNLNYAITNNSLDNFDIAFLKLENEKTNMIYSPLSIKYALGMLMQGAAGESLNQINTVLGQYQFHKFTSNKNMSFANALFIKKSYKNSVDSSYVAKLKESFGAEVKYDDFKKPDAINKYVSEKTFKLVNKVADDIKDLDYIIINALAINMNWVKTIQPDAAVSEDAEPFYVSYPHMKYSKSVQLLNESDFHELSFNNDPVAKQSVEIAAVINNYDIVSALGKNQIKKIVTEDHKAWVKKGAPDACEECDDDDVCKKDTKFDFEKYFKELSSSYKKVESSTDFELYVDDNVKVFRKKLKKSDKTTLEYFAVMPTKVTLEEYLNNLTANDLNDLKRKTKEIKLENFKEGVITEISGYIPLFSFDYELKLIDDLKQIGIKDVFDAEKANLSNLTSSKSYINEALHKATIDFSNEGIKAGAFTSEGGRGGGDCGYDYLFVPPVEKIDLTFDKPFIFFIMDKDTGEVWFTGRVYEPTKYKSYRDIYLEKHPEAANDDE